MVAATEAQFPPKVKANHVAMIPALVVGGFRGLRPAEFHAEGARRPALKWEAFIWNDNILHITGQKVRSKANRDIPLHPVSRAWLEPFKEQHGEIWKYKQANSKKLGALRVNAGVKSIYNGFRHSYASYRIRHLKGLFARACTGDGQLAQRNYQQLQTKRH